MMTTQMISDKDSFRSWSEDGRLLRQKLAGLYQNRSVDYTGGQMRKWLSRVKQPTGLYLLLSGDISQIDSESLVCQLSPFFRSVRLQNSSRFSPRVYKDVLKSTLVISVKPDQRLGILGIIASAQKAVIELDNGDQRKVIDTVLNYLESRLLKRYRIDAL
jgi:hypothetical protein